jgi:hypothetical protein
MNPNATTNEMVSEFYILFYIVTIMASSKAASPYKCKKCELAFSSRQDLDEHNRQIHQQ